MNRFVVERYGTDTILTYAHMHVRFSQWGFWQSSSWPRGYDRFYRPVSDIARTKSHIVLKTYKAKTGTRRFGAWHSEERKAFLTYMADELNKLLPAEEEGEIQ